jgi:hypothetical protein
MTATIHRHAAGLTWTEPGGMQRSAHALADGERVWLVDPFQDAAALDAAAQLGPPAAVLQLLDRHNRDGAAIARTLGIPHLVVPTAVPDSPLQATGVLDRRLWRETALWWPQRRTLIVAEALGTAPLFSLGRPVGIHPLLRLTPPRAALGRPDVSLLLVGHGPPLATAVDTALEQALGRARVDLPRLVRRLPGVLRGA